MNKLWLCGVLAFSSALWAAEPVTTSAQTVVVNDFEYTNKYELAIRQAQKTDDKAKGKAFPGLLEYAQYGEKLAQYMVGNFYLAGIGTDQNPTEGLIWMGVALEQRNPDWQRAFDAVTKNLSDEQKKLLNDLVQQRIALYGVKAQKMSCDIGAAVIGSNKRYHVCTKVRDGADRVTVVKYPAN